jgi:hypothetical protein
MECHGPARQDGGLRLDSQAAIKAGGDSGHAIDFDAIEKSEILRRVALPKDHDEVMPKRGDPLARGRKGPQTLVLHRSSKG